LLGKNRVDLAELAFFIERIAGFDGDECFRVAFASVNRKACRIMDLSCAGGFTDNAQSRVLAGVDRDFVKQLRGSRHPYHRRTYGSYSDQPAFITSHHHAQHARELWHAQRINSVDVAGSSGPARGIINHCKRQQLFRCRVSDLSGKNDLGFAWQSKQQKNKNVKKTLHKLLKLTHSGAVISRSVLCVKPPDEFCIPWSLVF
jgi:hypothetical protein